MALFIDAANLYTTAKVLGFGIDYDRLLKEFQSRGTVVPAFFYTTIIEDQDNVAKRCHMRDLNRRLDGLEATLALEGKPFVIWAMVNRRRMTDVEIDAAFQEAIASGRASPGDKPLAISWMVD